MRTIDARSKPLSEPVVWILLSLADQPRHGYAIIKGVEHLSGGRVRLGTGTLYGALRRLLDEAWIERVDLDDQSRDKQTYRLTSTGRGHLKRELDRIAEVARAGARLRPRRA